ncbi:binding-protein-dependent transport system inner membrane protein [Thermincola ferriacetica]|uniref:Binding-protein-dependent transport system inner membrane protein n=1 Tax=Thermincola ferriacetica TaxID=281456 RepID=A0A0L6W6G7_9FIRM|nr:ABC transporter permease [Thermincola ferriacetica]KNZ71115.1 binding-protein-dependent transport system inner membrane protein [Thermincola ferriacetica]
MSKYKTVTVISFMVLMVMAIMVIGAPLFTAKDPTAVELTKTLKPPGQGNWLGTDEMGRDIWTRLLYGGRVSLLVGVASVAVSTVLGVTYGAVSGYVGEWIDRVLMRIIDALLCLPSMLIMLVIQSMTKPSLTNVVLVIGFTTWMQMSRLVRTEVLSLKEREFVLAAKAAGTPVWKIILRHLVPHCSPTIIVMATVGVGHAILSEASLSFLGLGIPPHQPSWGNMLIGGQNQILAGAWWIPVFPGAMIICTVLAITFASDGLQHMLLPMNVKEGVNKWPKMLKKAA